ncbi:MAG TPA: HD domain-containing protein [Bacteroidota bacterium]|nr:HD domain-containing protein [Bacteroidota bacterium]
MIEKIELQDEVLRRVGAVADRVGMEAYVVGGYVRDVLLDKQVKDTDIVVVGSGVALAKLVAKEFHTSNVVVFEKFGTAMLPLEDRKLEFVGARKESYQKNSRKPHVAVGTMEDDLARRDFTVNAMAVSLNAKTRGTILDPFNGQRDLQLKILRTPLEPEATFDDDPLRLMRATRFASQLGFSIEPNVIAAASKMAGRLSIVSQERISDEFLKLLASPKPSIGLQWMFDAGLMNVVFPEIANLAGVDQRQDFHHKDVFRHTLMVVDKVAATSNNLWLRMTALLHDVAKPKTKAFKPDIGWSFHGHEEFGARMIKPIFQRMRFPMEHIPYVEKLVRLHLRPQALVDDGVTDSAIRRLMFECGNEIDDLMLLCRADITSKNPKLVEQVLFNYERVVQKMQEVEERDRIRNWQPPMRGEEIMRVCGITEGKMVGVLKEKITDAILDGVIPNDHEAALQYLYSIKEEVMALPPVKKKKSTFGKP